MATIKVFNQQGQPAGEVDLEPTVFGVAANPSLVHQAVIAERAALRQGTHKTKTRAEVSGGGRKPWRQKGTGRARQGSTRAPHWRHGGVTFGPQPRDHSVKLNRKMHAAAVRSALSARVQDALTVIDTLAIPSGKTKDMANLLKAVNANGKVLFILDGEFLMADEAEATVRSLRNLANVIDITIADDLAVYELLDANAIVTTRAAVEAIGEAYAK